MESAGEEQGMASPYGYRIAELSDLLAQVSAANDTMNQNLTTLVKQFVDIRQSAMNNLIDFLAKARPSNMGVQSKWQSGIASLRSNYRDLFAKAANYVMLPSAHQLL